MKLAKQVPDKQGRSHDIFKWNLRNRKTNIIFCFVYLSLFQVAFGQWQQIKMPYSVNLTSICQLSEEQLLLGGTHGAVLFTSDGGQHWDSLASGIRQPIISLAQTKNYCYALAGMDTLLFCPRDKMGSVSNWTKSKLPEKGGTELYFFDDYTGFICGKSRGELLKTTDGGQSWEILKSNLSGYVIHSPQFISSEVGFALTQDFDPENREATGHILKTSDGGKNWEIIYTDSAYFYNDLLFVNEQEAYAVGYKGSILASSDGGTSWQRQNSGTTENLLAIDFSEVLIGKIIGTMGTVLSTQNRGNTWSTLNIGNPYLFAALSFTDPNRGYLLVDGNLLLKTTTGGL